MTFEKEFESLIEKFAELLVGDSSPATIEQIKRWSLYQHINKTMPALTAHWTQTHPEAKTEVRRLFEDIRDRNAKHREKKAESESDNE